MYLNTTFRVYLTKNQEMILERLISNYEIEINKIVKLFLDKGTITAVPFKEIANTIPWNSKIEIIKQAKADYAKIVKSGNLEKLFEYHYCKWTDINFKYLDDQRLIIETFRKDIMLVKVFCNEFAIDKIKNNKLISLKIYKRKNKWLGCISYYIQEKSIDNNEVMGIDLGILVPAVIATSNNKIRFFGNGREKRFVHTKQKAVYDKISKDKSNIKIRYYNSWSNRLKDVDHKISKNIVNFAVENNVGTIKMERLGQIQKRNPESRKVSTWSYHRLMHYIIYKAKKEGIKVILVNPYNTSRKCPSCSQLNIANNREYKCSCGYKNHRDIVGAVNILNSPYSH
jgi:putative transposase